MSTKVPELIVVLLCVLGAGAVVTAFAAFGKSLFSKEEPERDVFQRTPEQDSYLRRVREMNQASIWGLARSQRRAERRQREMEASDIEIQSGRSFSNAGAHMGYSQNNGSHRGHGTSNTPVTTYYEEEYAGGNYSNAGYEEQQRPYTSGQGNLYANQPSKHGAAESWNEVPR